MIKIMHLFMLSCKKATELIEKKSVLSLSLKEKIQLYMHKSMCDACTAYEKQSEKIDELIHNHIHSEHREVIHNNELKEKIISKLP
jgi:UDP-2,3-diacylglucosamine pyrophosphatase LpxH